jgi:tricarballylate dehydrogenase
MGVGRDADVIVVGAGNAGFCAALSAAERGARVLLLEKAPDEWLGGNSYFTAGAIRTVHGGLQDAAELVEHVEPETRLDAYTAEDFRGDLERVTEGRCDPDLAALVVDESRDTVGWLAEQGVGLRLMYDR